jgi:hypothetical protein
MRAVRHIARLGALAGASAALLLTACGDAGETTAPSARPSLDVAGPTPETSPTLPPPAVAVTLHIDDQALYTYPVGVSGTTVEFRTGGGYARVVADNGPGDGDPAVGYYRVSMPAAASYTATVQVMPEPFAAEGASKTVWTLLTPSVVPMGSIVLLRKPMIVVSLYRSGVPVPGQTIQVFDVGGSWSTTITDGSSADRDLFGNPNPPDGVVSLRVPVTGTYFVCAITTPKDLWFADCQTVHATTYYFSYPAALTYVTKG